MHLATDAQLVTKRRYVIDQVPSRVVGQRRGSIIVAGTGRTLTAPALDEQDDPVPLRIKKPGERYVAARTRSAMHDHDRFACEHPVFLPINSMVGKSCCAQVTRPDEGGIGRLVGFRVVWSRCMGDCVQGDDVYD